MNLTDNRITEIIKDNGGNFTPSEFLDNREMIHPIIIQELVSWRNWHGFPIQITSAYRESGSHITGKAIDCIVWDDWKQTQPTPQHIWRLATTYPFLGVGLYNDWESGIGLHVDIIRQERQRPLRWLRIDGHYYYQNPEHGKFWNQENQDLITLEKAFRVHWNVE
jgi:hypothetical protein